MSDAAEDLGEDTKYLHALSESQKDLGEYVECPRGLSELQEDFLLLQESALAAQGLHEAEVQKLLAQIESLQNVNVNLLQTMKVIPHL